MKKDTYKTLLFILFEIYSLFTLTCCKKFLDIDAPTTSTNAENVYEHDNTAIAVLTGLYAQMMNSDFYTGGITSISLLTELSADNLVLFSLNRLEYLSYYQNSLNADYKNTELLGNYFSNLYPRIYTINAAIEGLTKTSSLTPLVKERLLGEAYFLRAFYYFYLTNLYNEVPLVLTTDYTKNTVIARSPTADVYRQMVSDLQQSQSLLKDNYVDASILKNTSERVRPNRSAASALLARVYLFNKNYAAAELAATEVINKTSQYKILPLNAVFLRNSTETIWALQPVKTGFNTDEGAIFLMPEGPSGNKLFYASPSLMASFEDSDKRLTEWTGNATSNGTDYPYIAKYKADANNNTVTEYNIVLRLAEQFLIRAEARAEQNNINGAQEDLNTIRQRAGLLPITAHDRSEIISYIFNERRVELFTEWGHRWLDLKRNSKINQLMQEAELYKGGDWQSYKALYPIPNTEISLNTRLTQNTGYTN